MARRSALHPLRLAAVMAALCVPALASAGPSDDIREMRDRLKAVEARMTDRPADMAAIQSELGLTTTVAPSGQLIGAGGLFALTAASESVPDQVAPPVPVDVSTTNFRLMLATLSQTYSGVNNLAVITAQGPRGPKALSIRSGRVTLSDLQSFSAAQGLSPRADGTLTAPVVLWPDATLVLSRGERLALARDGGAFILSMGQLDIDGALIEATGPENPHQPSFAPFITVLSGGGLSLRNATLRGLGFGRTAKFAGLTVAGNPLMHEAGAVVIEDNFFDDIKTVTVAGTSDARVRGNTFQNARSNALAISGATRAMVDGNLFHGKSPTNAIRVESGSDHVTIARNVFLRGARVAVLIDSRSHHVSVEDNVIWRRDGAGIKFLNTRCGRATGNLLIDNQQKGIEVRKSDGTVVTGNLFAGNRSAGVWVSAQSQGAQTIVRGNRFEGNGAGLSAATGAEIWIASNNFKRQLPKLLDGDIAKLTHAVVRDLGGSDPLKFVRGQAHSLPALVSLCGDDT